MGSLITPFTSRDLESLHGGDERWELVLRIASSVGFRRAPRLREFLCFVCDRAINGDTGALTEQRIGIDVFKRSADYSTTEDNVVRAQARQVRIKLAEYFVEAGKSETLLLEIPKGSYVPVFSARQEDTALPVLPREPVPAEPIRHSVSLLNVISALAALCLLGFFAVLWDDKSVRARVDAAESAPALLPPFSWMFDAHQPVTLVVADSGFGLYQDLIGRAATLEEYLNPRFFADNLPHSKDKELVSFSERLSTRQFSSYADLVLTQQILHLAGFRGEKISVRFARDLHLREMASGSFILIGSPYSNPWVSLFDKRRNFPTTLDPRSRRGVVTNRQPRAMEPTQFVMKGEDGLPGSTFGVLTFLPADAESGNVLLLDGLNMEGTEAAGAFLTEARAAQSLLDKVGLRPDSAKRYLEVVVETRAMAGTTRDSSLTAYRVGGAVK